jgi:hypothetical protein
MVAHKHGTSATHSTYFDIELMMSLRAFCGKDFKSTGWGQGYHGVVESTPLILYDRQLINIGPV